MAKQPSATPQPFVVEMWPIDRVTPYENNARIIPKVAVDKVAASISQYGWQQAIVVDAKGVIIAGHTRLRAAQALGLKEVPVKVAVGLTAKQVKAYRLADNRTAEESKWDDELLAKELTSIGKDAESIAALTGFDSKELDRILATTPENPPTDVIKKNAKALEPKTGVVAAKGASKVMHTCPECGHSWHSGGSAAVTKPGKAKTKPFGAADEDA